MISPPPPREAVDMPVAQTFKLRVNLKELVLILLESATDPTSTALICHTNAVLNAADANGLLEGSLEIQVPIIPSKPINYYARSSS